MASKNVRPIRDNGKNTELVACVEALGKLPDLLKPFAVTGTSLRLPERLGDQLYKLEEQLRTTLDRCHYEGTDYDHDVVTGLPLRHDSDLAARCEALGYELVVDDKGQQFVLGGEDGTDVVFIHRDNTDDDLAGWLEARERANASATETGVVSDYNGDGSSELDRALRNLKAVGDLLSGERADGFLEDTIVEVGMMIVQNVMEAEEAFEFYAEHKKGMA